MELGKGRVVHIQILEISDFSDIHRLHIMTLGSTHIDLKHIAIERSRRVDMI